LAQLAVDNKCPSVVKKTIEENFINGATLQEMKDEDFDELGAYEVAQFMFIYAGHGVPDKAGRGWIAPYGFQDSKHLRTGLRMNKIKDFAEQIGASQQLWIFDCCHAGNVLLGGRGDTTDFALSQARRPVIQVMTAVTKDQKAIEKEGNGVFSKVFCAKLEHMEKKYATFSELETHVNPRVFEYSGGKMAPQFGKMLWDHYGKPCDGQFVFFNANDPPIAKMSTPAAATGDTRGGTRRRRKRSERRTRKRSERRTRKRSGRQCVP
jgi:hypothetical protein